LSHKKIKKPLERHPMAWDTHKSVPADAYTPPELEYLIGQELKFFVPIDNGVMLCFPRRLLCVRFTDRAGNMHIEGRSADHDVDYSKMEAKLSQHDAPDWAHGLKGRRFTGVDFPPDRGNVIQLWFGEQGIEVRDDGACQHLRFVLDGENGARVH
jgi:hypothetical protein